MIRKSPGSDDLVQVMLSKAARRTILEALPDGINVTPIRNSGDNTWSVPMNWMYAAGVGHRLSESGVDYIAGQFLCAAALVEEVEPVFKREVYLSDPAWSRTRNLATQHGLTHQQVIREIVDIGTGGFIAVHSAEGS